MTTTIRKFTDAYATLTFAAYESLVLRWYSGLGIASLANAYVKRIAKDQKNKAMSMRSASVISRQVMASKELTAALSTGSIRRINISTPGFENEPAFSANPRMEIFDGKIFLGGRFEADAGGHGQVGTVDFADAPPMVFGSGAQQGLEVDVRELTRTLTTDFHEIVKTLDIKYTGVIPGSELKAMIVDKANKVLKTFGATFYGEVFQPSGEWLEFLSPIGIAHFYRQLYFYLSEGAGPIEQAFTVAPNETLEIVTETIRRQSHEEVYEQGSETVSEAAVESRNVDEVSDKVASMVQRDSSLAISSGVSIEASGGVGVYNFGASGNFGLNSTLSQSAQSTSEIAKKRLKEVTKRASERITKTFSLKVRDTTDFTTTNMQRRVLENKTAQPVNYGLRRVFNRIRVKVQDLGPNLVWQLYVSEPGVGLARSRFVHFAEGAPVSHPSEPPGIRPRPTGGVERGTTNAQLKRNTAKSLSDPMAFAVTLAIIVPPDRKITAVSIESVTDLEHLGKEDLAPSPTGASGAGTLATGVYRVDLGVLPGDAESVSVTYQYLFDPSDELIDAWKQEYEAAQTKFRQQDAEDREKALREQFDRSKALIAEKSKIRPRPSAALRKEERYEILNRMISHLFKPSGTRQNGAPAPIEIELFHRYFDVEAMFFFLHPSWWVPRYAGKASRFDRPGYEISAESEPARLGSSLGWAIQLDGDDRRNEFINSPWVRTCLPIRKGREREAIAWLAEHIESDAGYDPTVNPLKGLLQEIEVIRANERKVLGTGPDYVAIDTVVVASTTGAPVGPLKPENVYPVIDEFEVTVPTEGFVYDPLVISIP